jgi:hypothetical protein
VNRSAFLKRMAFAAMACAFLDVPASGLGAAEPDPFLGYGAIADDDAPWIQALIDAAEAAGGGHVAVPPYGDYVLGTTVHVPPDVALEWCDSRITFSGAKGPALYFYGAPHPETQIHRDVFYGVPLARVESSHA